MEAKYLARTLINNPDHDVMMVIPTVDNETGTVKYKAVDIETVKVLGCEKTLILLRPKL